MGSWSTGRFWTQPYSSLCLTCWPCASRARVTSTGRICIPALQGRQSSSDWRGGGLQEMCYLTPPSSWQPRLLHIISHLWPLPPICDKSGANPQLLLLKWHVATCLATPIPCSPAQSLWHGRKSNHISSVSRGESHSPRFLYPNSSSYLVNTCTFLDRFFLSQAAFSLQTFSPRNWYPSDCNDSAFSLSKTEHLPSFQTH